MFFYNYTFLSGIFTFISVLSRLMMFCSAWSVKTVCLQMPENFSQLKECMILFPVGKSRKGFCRRNSFGFFRIKIQFLCLRSCARIRQSLSRLPHRALTEPYGSYFLIWFSCALIASISSFVIALPAVPIRFRRRSIVKDPIMDIRPAPPS